MKTKKKTKSILLALGGLALSAACANAQSISHMSTTRMNLNRDTAGASDQFRISVVPGNARYVAAADGTLSATGLIGDGTLLDWQIFTAVNATPFTGATVSAGTGLYLDTATCADSSAGGPQEWFDVWTTGDILVDAADIGTGLTPAVGNGPTPLTGNVDISGVESGKFFVMHGNFGQSARVNMTMTGPGQPPIVLPTYFTENPGSQNRMWLMEFTFANPNGNYYNIQWTVDNNQNSTGRRRTGGIFLDGTLYVDTVEPAWVATWPNAGPVSSTLFTLNGNTNEDSTAYYVVLPDAATPPTSAQVKAGTDASNAPVALSGDFALSALVPGSEMVTGLTASTAYDVYFVAEDVRGPNLQAAPVLVDVTTNPPDVTAPGWTATYPQQSRTPAGLTGIGNMNEPGTAYFVVLPSGASAPTSAQVKAGSDASDAIAPSGSMSLPAPGVDGTDAVGGLTVGTTYDVYFAAEDLEGNLQASPQLVTSAPVAPLSQFATGGFAWGTASVWSGITGGPYTAAWGDGNNAVFEGTAGVVPVVSGTIVNDMTFSGGNFILQGGPLTLIGTTQPTITVSAGIPRLEGAIAGTQGFIKSGSGTLQMTSTVSNTMTGGIVISEGFLGDNGGPLGTNALNNNQVTANGGTVGLVVNQGTTTDGGITLTSGTLRISNNNGSFTVNGAVTGPGGIELNKTGGGQNILNLNSTSNTFTGGVDYTSDLNVFLNVNSFADSGTFGTGNIRFGVGAGLNRSNRFTLGSGAIVPLDLTNRQFDLTGANDYVAEIFNSSAQAFTIDSDLLVSGTNNKRLTLAGDGAGISTFSGDIGNGSATALNLTKAGSGTWVLSGTNTYNGTTTVTGGTLRLVGGSHASPITLNNGTKLGFTPGSPTTSTAALTLNGTSTITITGAVDNASDYKLMTFSGITGTPTLDSPITDYELELQNGNTELWLVFAGGNLFDSWAATGSLGPVTFAGDTNGDGVQDGLAFLLGASTPDVNATGLLPTASESGGNLVMEFDCLATAGRGAAVLELQYDGNLVAPWTTVPVPGAVGVPNPIVETTATGSVSFVATANGSLIHIVATISDATESGGGKIFGRLQGTE